MFVTYIQKITFIYNIKKNEVNYAELKKWLIYNNLLADNVVKIVKI